MLIPWEIDLDSTNQLPLTHQDGLYGTSSHSVTIIRNYEPFPYYILIIFLAWKSPVKRRNTQVLLQWPLHLGSRSLRLPQISWDWWPCHEKLPSSNVNTPKVAKALRPSEDQIRKKERKGKTWMTDYHSPKLIQVNAKDYLSLLWQFSAKVCPPTLAILN